MKVFCLNKNSRSTAFVLYAHSLALETNLSQIESEASRLLNEDEVEAVKRHLATVSHPSMTTTHLQYEQYDAFDDKTNTQFFYIDISITHRSYYCCLAHIFRRNVFVLNISVRRQPRFERTTVACVRHPGHAGAPAAVRAAHSSVRLRQRSRHV